MSKYNKSPKRTRRLFLLSFFDHEDGYEVKEVNGFYLIKHWDGNSQTNTVALFTKESYESMTANNPKNKLPTVLHWQRGGERGGNPEREKETSEAELRL